MTAVALPATAPRIRTWWVTPALVAGLAAAGVWWSLAPYLVGVFHDDGVYALLARSIASGEGFHYSHLPGAPAATHYPPLYPLLLGALWRIAPAFPENLSVLLGLNALLAGIAAAGWWTFAARRLGWRSGAAAAAALVAAMTAPMLTLAGALLSEMLFVALLWPSLQLAERVIEDGETREAAVAGLMIGALMLVRTHALALLVAVLALAVVKRRRRQGIIVFVAAVMIQLPWIIWTSLAAPRVAPPLEGAYGSYLGWFVAGIRDGGAGIVLETARINTRELGLLLRDRFTTGVPLVDSVALALVIGCALTGAVSFARRAPVTLVFAATYFAIVIVWPYAPWRFAWAAWPLVFMMLLEGLRALWLRSPRSRVVARLVAALPLLALLRTELHSYSTRGWRMPARQAAVQLAPLVEWARRATDPRDVLLVEGEQVIALYTGRHAAPPVSFTALEYTRRDSGRAAASLRAMLEAVPATRIATLSPDVRKAALAFRHATVTLVPVPAPPPIAAFGIRR